MSSLSVASQGQNKHGGSETEKKDKNGNSKGDNNSSDKTFFRRSFGRRHSGETLKERARAGKLKSPGSSIGKPPVKALSSPHRYSRSEGILTKEIFAAGTNASAVRVVESSFLQPAPSEEAQTESVRVALRLRPLNPLEVLASKRASPLLSSHSKSDDAFDCFKAWNIETHEGRGALVQKGTGRKIEGKNMFTFDGVFHEDHSTSYVYEGFARPIVKAVLTGKHGTIFTYGTSGSGKTHSMQGDGKNGSLHKNGIIQLAVRDLFNHIKRDSGRRGYVMRISFFEIYNEQVRDLLTPNRRHNGRSPSKSTRGCSFKPTVASKPSHSNGRRFDLSTANATKSATPPHNQEQSRVISVDSEKKQVSSVDDVLKLLSVGNQNRAVATTILNDTSSRSHAIFRLTIESRERLRPKARQMTSESDHIVRVSALNFVDLAGSENTTKAATMGSRRRESGKINQSLLSLSQVIHALSLPLKKRPKFINYRNSKLTRILQPHLSGNAVLAVLCCATPACANLEETRGTLKFGHNAKRIQMKPIVNEIVDDRALIKKLQRELKEAKETIQVMTAAQKNYEMAEAKTSATDPWVMEISNPLISVGASPTPSESSAKGGGASISGDVSCTSNSIIVNEQRLEEPESREKASNHNRAEASPSPSASVTREPVPSPSISNNNQLYDIADFDAVLLESRLRPAVDSKAVPPVQQDCSSTLSDLSSRRPPTIRIVQDSPPSEVTIIRSPLSDIGDDVDVNVRLNDAEERAKFLEEKLEAADRLVELMTRDLRNARLCIHELVFRNVRLENQLASVTSTATVPSTVNVSESHIKSDTEDDGHPLMSCERIGI